jgi:uncharacterized membrane protein
LIYLDRIIEPNHALSRKGMMMVLSFAAMCNVVTAGFMLAIGAYPVPLFLGLDMLAISIAFFAMDRRRRRRLERIEITADRVAVFRPPNSPEPLWAAAPIFARVVLACHDPDLPMVRLVSSGRTVTLGSELGAEGRAQLADQVSDALQMARAERHQTPL